MSEVEEEAVVPGALRAHNDESPAEMSIPSVWADESESDTKSIPGIDKGTRRRLSLIWPPDPVSV